MTIVARVPLPLPPPPDPAACPWERVEVLLAGDVMAHGDQLAAASRSDGSWDFTTQFDAVAPWIRGADLALANLETVMAGPGSGYTGYPTFNTPDALADALVAAGFDVVQTANNHCLDRGGPGLLRTIEVLDRAGLAHVGTWAAPDTTPWVTADIGPRVAVAGGTFSLNGFTLPKNTRWGATPIEDLTWIVASARTEADLVIAGIHWGWEYEPRPRKPEVALASAWVAAGADVVWGHHPHVIQPVEQIDDAVVAYSHGNLVSGQRTFPRAGGLLTRIELAFCPVTRETRIADVRLMPTWVDLRDADGRKVFRVVPADAGWIDADGGLSAADRVDALRFRAHAEALLGPLSLEPPGVGRRREEVAWAADPTGMARTTRFLRGAELAPGFPAP